MTTSKVELSKVMIGDTFYVVPVEVAGKLTDLESKNEALQARTAELEAQRSAEEFKTASMIIMNLRSDKMGTSQVLPRIDFGILDDYWAELEGRIVHALRGETLNGDKYTPNMIPTITGGDAEEFIKARRKAQHINDNQIVKDPVSSDPDDPIEKRKRRRAYTVIE